MKKPSSQGPALESAWDFCGEGTAEEQGQNTGPKPGSALKRRLSLDKKDSATVAHLFALPDLAPLVHVGVVLIALCVGHPLGVGLRGAGKAGERDLSTGTGLLLGWGDLSRHNFVQRSASSLEA